MITETIQGVKIWHIYGNVLKRAVELLLTYLPAARVSKMRIKTSCDCVRYTTGYKFRLEETVLIETHLRPDREIRKGAVILTRGGMLIILSGFSWDGATGAYNNRTIFKAAVGHDALYYLLRECKDELLYKCAIMREGSISVASQTTFDMIRDEADKTLIDIAHDNGMWSIRQAWVYRAVKRLGFSAAYRPRQIKCT
jgi:hypothetical protein